MKTPLQRSKQTKLFRPFSSWQITTTLQTSIITSTEFPTVQSQSPQRCPRSTGNLKKSSCLKNFSRQASKSKINWLKRTESTTSSLCWGEIHYKHLKKLMAQPQRLWEKSWQFLEEIRKTPIDGDSETQIPETCLLPSKSKVSNFFWWISITGQRRNRNCCPRQHWTIHIRQNATTPVEIKKSGSLGEWHIWTHCYTPKMRTGAERFGSSWRSTNKHCEPACHRHKSWRTQTNVPQL